MRARAPTSSCMQRARWTNVHYVIITSGAGRQSVQYCACAQYIPASQQHGTRTRAFNRAKEGGVFFDDRYLC